jgi:hypothetical protein
MWWQSAASVLPTSPNVWYFNPTYVVAQIAGHAHRFVGTVVVRLSGAATQVHSVRLMDGQREVDEEEVETPISPDGVELGPAPPGSYSVEALNASGRVIQSMPFTIQVGLHGDLPMVIQPASAPPAPPPP